MTTLLPVHIDILVARGANGSMLLKFMNPVTNENYDISNDTIIFVVREGYNGAVLFQRTKAPGEHTNPTSGETLVSWTAAEVADMENVEKKKEYRHTVWRKLQTGERYPFFDGQFLLHPVAAPEVVP